MATLRLVLLSDTHGLPLEADLPDGDILLHAGDFTMRGEEAEVEAFASWIAALPHREKVVIAGNHDFLFERNRQVAEALLPREVHYLQDSGVTLQGLRIWGSPWQPWFYDWAFNLPRGPEIRAKWELIPPDTDILITHGPPADILDRNSHGQPVGCVDLAERVAQLRLLLHLFGHIHEAYGELRKEETLFVNASTCDLRYRARNRPIVVDVDPEKRTARTLSRPIPESSRRPEEPLPSR
jgi:predicted phosphohydrolase